MAQFELPLAQAQASLKHVPAEYYYRIPIRTIYRSYPPVAPGHDFDEYINRLEQAEPEILFDASKLRSREDWIRAGKAVFEAPTSFVSDGVRSSPSHAFLGRYVVRRKGHVDRGNMACASCHVRRMADGTIIAGAQEYFASSTTARAVPAGTPAETPGYGCLDVCYAVDPTGSKYVLCLGPGTRRIQSVLSWRSSSHGSERPSLAGADTGPGAAARRLGT